MCGSNAVNITDGLDGLAGLIAATAFVAYGMIAGLQGQVFLVRFCFTMVGRAVRVPVVQRPPGRAVHGRYRLAGGRRDAGRGRADDRRSGCSCRSSRSSRSSETVSEILQVGYFKLTKGKRLFKMAPLHHHFELLGWSETQVVQRFWLIGLLAAMIGVALAVA